MGFYPSLPLEGTFFDPSDDQVKTNSKQSVPVTFYFKVFCQALSTICITSHTFSSPDF